MIMTLFSKNISIFLIFIFCLMSINIIGQQLKVIAYNVEFGKSTTPTEMASLLKQENADVICFNEVPKKGWTKRVGKLLNMRYSYEGKTASANHIEDYKDKTEKYSGKFKSILSKYPLKKKHEIILDGIRWDPASAVIATVKVNKKQDLLLFSLHIPTGIDEPIKSKAYHLSQILKEYYLNYDNIILAGDFNDLNNSKPMQYLYDIGFKNPYEVLKIDLSGKTTLSKEKNNGKVIDHILFRGPIVKGAEIIENKLLSDHKPVWATFKLKK